MASSTGCFCSEPTKRERSCVILLASAGEKLLPKSRDVRMRLCRNSAEIDSEAAGGCIQISA